MLDAVLLEWQGVLADTASARRDALLRALADEGVHFDAAAYSARCEGLAVRAAAAAALEHTGRRDETLADLVTLRATRAFAERLGKGFMLASGAREFVERVQLGARVAIVTLATRAETEFVLRLAGLDAAVSTIVSDDDALDAPPSPAMYERAIEQLTRTRPLLRERVVAIASTSPSLRAARAAGVRTVAVGAPAHVCVDANGAISSIAGLTLLELSGVAGVAAVERRR